MSVLARSALTGPLHLQPILDALCAATDVQARLQNDPLGFVRRYADPGDAELAAVFASGLAYGRVSLFRPVLEALLDRMDARGGPRRFATEFKASYASDLATLNYRWTRGPDLSLLAQALGRVVREHGRLGAVFEAAFSPEHPDLAGALESGVRTLQAAALAEAPRLGIAASRFEELPRGLRNLLPLPTDGSACKRWNLLLRWLVRRPGPSGADGIPLRADGVDLGIWDLPPRLLTIPLDTHVGRLAWFLGLTDRKDGSWRTAREITAGLALLDPEDPVRFDFALAHLGMSQRCLSVADVEICGACPLQPVCRVGVHAVQR